MAITGYTKLFNSIVTSTIWSESNATRLVWITMLASSDKDGYVPASIPGLAHLARVDLEECKQAIKTLESPDQYSRSQEFDGRRIEKVDGGWKLLNHAKYRRLLSEQERREYLTEKQREYRERDKVSTVVDKSELSSTVSTHTDTDTDTKEDSKANTRDTVRAHELVTTNFLRVFNAYPNKIDKRDAFREWLHVPFAEKEVETILAGIAIWSSSEQWEEPRFIPSLAKFLKNRRWESRPVQGKGKIDERALEAARAKRR